MPQSSFMMILGLSKNPKDFEIVFFFSGSNEKTWCWLGIMYRREGGLSTLWQGKGQDYLNSSLKWRQGLTAQITEQEHSFGNYCKGLYKSHRVWCVSAIITHTFRIKDKFLIFWWKVRYILTLFR